MRLLMNIAILLLLNIIIFFSIQYLFIDDNIFYNSYRGQMALSRIDRFIEISQKGQWLSYAFLPVVIVLRVFYTSIFLYIGIYFTDLKIEFGELLKITLLADFVYVLSGLAKLVILIFFKQVRTLEDLQFTPLSLMDLMNSKTIDPLFIYPLSLLNIFELAYFFILAWLLVGVISESNEEEPVKFGQSLKLVTTSYGSGLLLWVLFVMFITLNLS